MSVPKFIAHLEAIKKFMKAMEGSECFEDVVRSQKTSVELALSSVELGLEDAEKVIVIIRDPPWPPAEKSSLMQQVTAKAGKTMTVKSKLQHYEELAKYFTGPQWKTLTGENVEETQKLEVIVDAACALGLKFPSEPSIQAMTGLLLLCSKEPHEAMAMSAQCKHEYFKHCKFIFNKRQKGTPIEWVSKLRAEPPQFKEVHGELHAAVFGADGPAICPLSPVFLSSIVA
jgi:hypothetical protein